MGALGVLSYGTPRRSSAEASSPRRVCGNEKRGRMSLALAWSLAALVSVGCERTAVSVADADQTVEPGPRLPEGWTAPDSAGTVKTTTCPSQIPTGPAVRLLWPRCPVDFPVASWGGLCDEPRCMRPCRVRRSEGPGASIEAEYTYVYSLDGRVLREDDVTRGTERTFVYDDEQRLTTVRGSRGYEERYEFGADGRLHRFEIKEGHWDPRSFEISWGRYGVVRVRMEDGERVDVSEFEYDDMGRVSSETLRRLKLVERSTYQYKDGRLNMVVRDDDARRHWSWQHGRVAWHDGLGATRFEYDRLGRLQSMDQRPDVAPGYWEFTYKCTP